MHKRKEIIFYGLLFVAVFAFYAYTAPPGVYDGDSGEMATVVHTLGLAHPTGFPAYILVGKFVSLFGGSNVAYTLNLLSAFFVSAAALLLIALMRELGVSRSAALLGTAFFVLGRSIWYHAGIAAVYPMSVLCIVVLLWLFVRWQKNQETSYLYWYVGIWGIAMGTHALMLTLVVPLGVMIWKCRKQLGGAMAYAKLAGILLLAACQYLYLPIAYGRHQIITFGALDSFGGFLNYITQHDYVFKVASRGVSDIGPFLGAVLRTLSLEYGAILLPIAVVGWWLLRRDNRQLADVLVGVVGVNVAMMFFYGTNADLEILHRYLYPSYIAYALLVAIAIEGVYRYARLRGTQWMIIVSVLIIAALAAAFQANGHYDNRHDISVVGDFASNVLATAQQNALIVTEGDAVTGPILYLQSIGKRGDVVIVDDNALTLDWYVENTHHRYPDVVSEDLKNLVGTNRDNHKAKRLMALIRANVSKRPVYLAAGVDDVIAQNFDLFPMGVLVQVFPKGTLNVQQSLAKADELWRTYALKGVEHNEYYSPQVNDIVRFYAVAVGNLGIFNYLNKRPDQALQYMEKSVLIDSTYAKGKTNLDGLKNALGK